MSRLAARGTHQRGPQVLGVWPFVTTALVGLGFSALAVGQRAALLGPLMPAIHWMLTQRLDSHFALLQMRYVLEGAHGHIDATFGIRQLTLVGTQVMAPEDGAVIQVSHADSECLQAVIVGLALAIAWPLPPVRRSCMALLWMLRVALTTMLLAVFTLLDTPLSIVSELCGVIAQHAEVRDTSLFVDYGAFMTGGGRYASGLVLGVLAILALEHLCSRRGWTAEPAKHSASRMP